MNTQRWWESPQDSHVYWTLVLTRVLFAYIKTTVKVFVRNMKKLLTNPKIIHMIISAMKLCMVLRSMMSIVSLLLCGLNKERKLILVLN